LRGIGDTDLEPIPLMVMDTRKKGPRGKRNFSQLRTRVSSGVLEQPVVVAKLGYDLAEQNDEKQNDY